MQRHTYAILSQCNQWPDEGRWDVEVYRNQPDLSPFATGEEVADMVFRGAGRALPIPESPIEEEARASLYAAGFRPKCADTAALDLFEGRGRQPASLWIRRPELRARKCAICEEYPGTEDAVLGNGRAARVCRPCFDYGVYGPEDRAPRINRCKRDAQRSMVQWGHDAADSRHAVGLDPYPPLDREDPEVQDALRWITLQEARLEVEEGYREWTDDMAALR